MLLYTAAWLCLILSGYGCHGPIGCLVGNCSHQGASRWKLSLHCAISDNMSALFCTAGPKSCSDLSHVYGIMLIMY